MSSPPRRLRVAVVSGGRSSEHEVSLESGRSVAEALARLGHEVVPVAIDREGRWGSGPGRLPDANAAAALTGADVVFPVLHGPFGEDGTVQGLLELADVPYVGSGVAASSLCMDKDLFKAVMRDAGVPVTRNLTLRPGDAPRTPGRFPVFVKPARLGSSVGISRAHDEAELASAVALAFEHDDKVLVEEGVEGVEVEVGVLGNDDPVASPPGEIVVAGEGWYDYEAKYAEGGMELVVPARVPEDAARRAQELAVRAFVVTECAGLARVDMFVTGDGDVLVNELNTIPGFTATSVYAKLFEAAGIPYEDLLGRLLELALERAERRRSLRF